MAAQALEAAAEQGKFWELHDALLGVVLSGESDPPTVLDAAAERVGLDMSRFEASFRGQATRDVIEGARQRAVSRGIDHTGIYLDGRAFPYVAGADLKSAINAELRSLGRQ